MEVLGVDVMGNLTEELGVMVDGSSDRARDDVVAGVFVAAVYGLRMSQI
jgi:hypothetical protein